MCQMCEFVYTWMFQGQNFQSFFDIFKFVVAEGKLRRSVVEEVSERFFAVPLGKDRNDSVYSFFLTVHVLRSSIGSFGIIGGIFFSCCTCISQQLCCFRQNIWKDKTGRLDL